MVSPPPPPLMVDELTLRKYNRDRLRTYLWGNATKLTTACIPSNDGI